MNIKKLATKIVQKAIDNGPTIFMTVAIGGAIVSAYGFVKATLKSRDALDEREKQINDIEEKAKKDPSIDEAAKKEMIKQININFAKKVAPNYILPAATLALEIAAIMGCHKGHGKKEAVMAVALNAVSDNAEKLVEKGEEIVGKKKMSEIKDEAAIEQLKKVAQSNTVINETGHGSEIFYFEPTGQLFRSSTPFVYQGINYIDHILSSGEVDFAQMTTLLDEWSVLYSTLADECGFSAEKFTKGCGGMSLFEQTKIRTWENADTGEMWKIIKMPYEIYANGTHISVPAY